MARSAASSMSTVRSMGTVKGSSRDRRLVAAHARVAGRPGRRGRWATRAEARAMRTASAATSSASGPSMRPELAKPQAPSTRTRTPKPSVSPRLRPSTRPALDGGDLVPASHDADVGIARRRAGGGIEGASGQVSMDDLSVAKPPDVAAPASGRVMDRARPVAARRALDAPRRPTPARRPRRRGRAPGGGHEGLVDRRPSANEVMSSTSVSWPYVSTK